MASRRWKKAKAPAARSLRLPIKRRFQNAVKPVWTNMARNTKDMIKRSRPSEIGVPPALRRADQRAASVRQRLAAIRKIEKCQTVSRAMDSLYLVCVVVGCTALVLISAVIPWAVFNRYVLNARVVARAARGSS